MKRKLKPREMHGMIKTVEYKSWSGMINRCTNPKCADYKDYGKRGIVVCSKWRNSFITFYQDMGRKPSKNYSLDRIDVNKGYFPGNCRWATPKQQARNRRNSIYVTLGGTTLHFREWIFLLKIRDKSLYGNMFVGELNHLQALVYSLIRPSFKRQEQKELHNIENFYLKMAIKDARNGTSSFPLGRSSNPLDKICHNYYRTMYYLTKHLDNC